jgi:hydroxyacylglutathione hydrolase
MIIQQFYDKALAHASYCIISEGKSILIDPSRDPKQYYDFVKEHNSSIVGVIETHPHADFVSAHLQIAQETGASIYQSKLVNPEYSFIPFDDGDEIVLGKIKLKSINTPGHSPDSISILVLDEQGKEHAVFTGDTLFIGDVGRPDLRESAGAIQQDRVSLAKDMYHSLRSKLMKLADDCIVFPAHGAGSLCGKNLSSDTQSTIGREKMSNYALQDMSEEEFVKTLLEDQPFMPKYFGYDVELNKKGAPAYQASIELFQKAVVVDTREAEEFKKSHFKGAINLPNGGKFETWLGSIVGPNEKYLLILNNESERMMYLEKVAKIGYEQNLLGMVLNPIINQVSMLKFNRNEFDQNQKNFEIIDIRNSGEVEQGKVFTTAKHIPLYELRERFSEVNNKKPILVHCAGGYRSAAGSSILHALVPDAQVFDLGTLINEYSQKVHA